MNKIIDCVTFFDNNFMFEFRYRIMHKFVDYFVICESLYDHKNKPKKKLFKLNKFYNKKKIKYYLIDKPFPKKNDRWKNQAFQREQIFKAIKFASKEDYIFFSDPDEIVKPEILKNFNLKKKYGIFLQDSFNYKFNLYNSYESPWEGTRVAKKKDLKSIDFLRQKIKSKNLNYNFYRFDKERNIQLFKNAGWHFNNIMSPKLISRKLKTFAHSEFSSLKFSSEKVIKNKINKKVDLFNRGHVYTRIDLNKNFPKYLLKNQKKYKKFILNS